MALNIMISQFVFSLTVLGFVNLASATRPLAYLPLHLDASSFLEDFRRNLPPFPQAYSSQTPVELDHIGANVRFTDTPLQVEAGFYLRPRFNGRGLELPPFLPAHLFQDGLRNIQNQRPLFNKPLLTLSRPGEIPYTPKQLKNYQDDLKKIEQERAEELTSTTSGNSGEDITTSSPLGASSFVNVDVSGGNNQGYTYNYSL